MAGHELNILRSELTHATTFRDDVANELVVLIKPALLIGLVRITVEYMSAPFTIDSHLDRPWILEFGTVVRLILNSALDGLCRRKNYAEELLELRSLKN